MVGNWRRAFERGRELFPKSEYFAWVSDHDIWHPRWLEVLVGVLDQHPQVVLAYPLMQRVFPTHRFTVLRRFDTHRHQETRHETSARSPQNDRGQLRLRINPHERARTGRRIHRGAAPDRHVLMQLLMLGQFSHVPQVLWYREVAGAFSYTRQRRMFFPTHIPLHTYCP
jgi:hypothetical protein